MGIRVARLPSLPFIGMLLLWPLHFLVVVGLPILAMVVASFKERDILGGGFASGWSLDGWRSVFSADALSAFSHSAAISLSVTVICAILAIPSAEFVAGLNRRWSKVALGIVMLPMSINTLLVAYSWQLFLANEGPLNSGLLHFGLIDGALPLVFNTGAVVIGLVGTYLPYFFLPVYIARSRLDDGYIYAAMSLGGAPHRVRMHVIFPMIFHSIVGGALLVALPVFAEFIVPDILGGGKVWVVGTFAADAFGQGQNWPLGAAVMALTAFLLFLIILPVALRVSNIVWEHGA